MNLKHAPRPPGSPFEAFREVVYAHGVDKLAAYMGLRPGTLHNKADSTDDTHHQPTMRDVILATQATGDFRILDAMNEMFGRAAFDVTPMAHMSDEALLELVMRYGQENGEFHGAFHAGLKAPKFRSVQFNHIRSEAFDVVSALMTLVARLEGLVDDE